MASDTTTLLGRSQAAASLSPRSLAGGAASPPDPRRWFSQQLFGDRHEVQIAHGDSVYRLRITSLGKLILTK